MKVDELVKIALVGTGQTAAVFPAETGALADAVATLEVSGPESKLLRMTALASAYEFCGRTPSTGSATSAASSPDVRSACSPRADDLLSQLLAMTNTPAKLQLVREWLGLAQVAGNRVPHQWLPSLLEYGAAHLAIRDRISQVIDSRGHWLMAQNPRWRFAVGEQEDAKQIWVTGTSEQRKSTIRRLRAVDPAAACGLIQSTWNEDGADDRAAFVAALSVSLSKLDEPFLESALDDRSKQVRAAAADLLSRLTSSAYLVRMVERARQLLAIKSGNKGGLLRRATPSVIEITLPAALDPILVRDAINEKPAVRMGEKQWWLHQIIACIPPTYWSTSWQLEPAACIAAAAGDFQTLLITAWTDASLKHPDVQWARALLLDSAERTDHAIRVDLLDALPAENRLSIVTELLESKNLPFEVVAKIITSAKFQFDDRSAVALFQHIDRRSAQNTDSYDYHLQGMLGAVGLRVPAESHDELAARWTGPYWELNRKALDQCLQFLQIRRDMRREFTK